VQNYNYVQDYNWMPLTVLNIVMSFDNTDNTNNYILHTILHTILKG